MHAAFVTGAAGFIGSHLCAALLARGYTVHGLDSLSDHYSPARKLANVAVLRADPRFRFHVGDLTSAPLDALVARASAVFHFAARPGVRDSWAAVEDYERANVVASRRVADACARHGTRLVYASSSSVYGDAASLPVREDAPLRPVSPYGATKARVEEIVAARELDAVGLRYFTVYGPRQRPDMAFARFAAAASGGRPVAVYGDGRQRRDFTYVGDAVEATIAAADRGAGGAVYNVASGDPRPLVAAIDVLGETLGMCPHVRFEWPQRGDVRHTWGDISKARAELGWEPQTSLEDGLAAQLAGAAAAVPA